MHEFIVKVPDTQSDFFKELLDNLKISFQTTAPNEQIKVHEQTAASERQAFVDDLRESFKEVKAAKRGEVKLQNLASFLDELDSEVAVNAH